MKNYEIKDSLNNLRKAFNDLKEKFEIMIDILDEQEQQRTNTEDTGTTVRMCAKCQTNPPDGYTSLCVCPSDYKD